VTALVFEPCLKVRAVGAVAVALDRDQLAAERDLRAQRLGQQRRDLVVAAAHVELLVGGPEEWSLVSAPYSML
jgi:hypothetical protein